MTALSAIGTSFGKLLPSLAGFRQVIAVEQQAHGHTTDIDCPLSIGETMKPEDLAGTPGRRSTAG